jgi:hypothetical protein
MQGKKGGRTWWMLTSFVMIVVAIAAPTISPLKPPMEKECKDFIDTKVCKYVDRVRTLCCLSQMLFDCGAVEMWQHTKKGTYHFKNPTDCDNTYTACYPYDNPCIP